MSHISTIELEIKDLTALKKACETLGLSFITGQTTYNWYGRLVNPEKTPLPEGITEAHLGHCDHAIRVPNAEYEIGVVQLGNKHVLLADFWYAGGLKKAVGKDGGLLKQAYAVERIKTEARKKGYRLTQKRTETGIRVTLMA